jgi:hypothetical protein
MFDIPDYVLCRSVRKILIIAGHNITTVQLCIYTKHPRMSTLATRNAGGVYDNSYRRQSDNKVIKLNDKA